jgi:serine/threonine protein kinase
MPAATASDLGALERAQGTLGYMAPEQVRGQRASPASDLYSVGLVLLECLAGRPARDLRGASLYAAVERVGAGDVELDGVPKAWQPLLARALERDPARRWPSAHAMRQAILDLRG